MRRRMGMRVRMKIWLTIDDIAGDDQVVIGGEMIRIADYLGED